MGAMMLASWRASGSSLEGEFGVNGLGAALWPYPGYRGGPCVAPVGVWVRMLGLAGARFGLRRSSADSRRTANGWGAELILRGVRFYLRGWEDFAPVPVGSELRCAQQGYYADP